MLYQKEIHEINQLTKRFHRDCRRIFAQIRQDIEETTLTKDEIKALVAAFGKLQLGFRLLTLFFRTTYRYLGEPSQLYTSQI